ncbi:HET-domain-containing protein, partial [Setomelanomma holmii]
ETRIVNLFPGKLEDSVRCTFETVELSSVYEEYEAISYTWATEGGDDMKTGCVYCDERIIPVTKNCEAILRRLRRPWKTRRVWVDAICINQVNTSERNHQVGLMDHVYRKASNVLI